MSKAFAVGDLALLVKHYSCPQYEGEVVVIVGGLELRCLKAPGQPVVDVMAYMVKTADDTELGAEPYQLKPLPPENTAATWKSLRGIWQPDMENAMKYTKWPVYAAA